jgi:hypothetical protein
MTYAQYETLRQPLLADLRHKTVGFKEARKQFGEDSPEFKEAVRQYNVAFDACDALTKSARKQGAFKDSGMSL